MPVLILTVFCGIAFFLVFALLIVADVSERRELRRRIDWGSDRPLAALSLQQAFDPPAAPLWRPILEALQRLEFAGDTGLIAAGLLSLYVRSATRFPEVYDGSCFDNWVDFFVENRLVVRSGTRLWITAEGRRFLHSCLATQNTLAA